MKASVTEGPARSAMAAAVRTKRPAPMMAPIPSPISDHEPRVRLRPLSASAPLSAMRRSIDFVRVNALATQSPCCVLQWTRLFRLLHPGGPNDPSRLRADLKPQNVARGEGGVKRSEERRGGKECRSRWSPHH